MRSLSPWSQWCLSQRESRGHMSRAEHSRASSGSASPGEVERHGGDLRRSPEDGRAVPTNLHGASSRNVAVGRRRDTMTPSAVAVCHSAKCLLMYKTGYGHDSDRSVCTFLHYSRKPINHPLNLHIVSLELKVEHATSNLTKEVQLNKHFHRDLFVLKQGKTILQFIQQWALASPTPAMVEGALSTTDEAITMAPHQQLRGT